jgi:hypothetical protein
LYIYTADVDGTLSGAAAGTTVVPDWPHLRGGCAAVATNAASGLAAAVPVVGLYEMNPA